MHNCEYPRKIVLNPYILKQDCHVAITDLGISRHLTATQGNITNIGTDLWMAPEIQGTNPRFGHPADVYGFGLIAMFLMTFKYPLGKDVTGEEILNATWFNIFDVAYFQLKDLSSG